jgi:hypothetical protein
MDRPRFVPVSTYRLQVHGGFTFAAAQVIVPYLTRLGVGAVYTSPYFAAEPGSTHGYDITNHNEISAEAGGADAHAAFTDAVREAGLQYVASTVPNHMGISTATNPGGATSSPTARRRCRPALRATTGTRSARSCGTSCRCRSSVTSRRAGPRARELQLQVHDESLTLMYFWITGCRSTRGTRPTCSGCPTAAGRAR